MVVLREQGTSARPSIDTGSSIDTGCVTLSNLVSPSTVICSPVTWKKNIYLADSHENST